MQAAALAGKNDQHLSPRTDIEISQAAELLPIADIARDRLGIPAEELVPYGYTKAKISLDYIAGLADRPDGKLILVTAITPTPAGDFSVLALRTLMKVVAGYTGKSFAQVQADFKAQWNADFSDQQLP